MILDLTPLKLKLYSIELDTGEAGILIPPLVDTEKHPHEHFAELYHLRWPVECDYKTMEVVGRN